MIAPISRRSHGRAVTIWPDNDKPGIEHGKRVAAKLRRLGCNVEMIDVAALGLPEGGDIIDWLKPIRRYRCRSRRLPRIAAAGRKRRADGTYRASSPAALPMSRRGPCTGSGRVASHAARYPLSRVILASESRKPA